MGTRLPFALAVALILAAGGTAADPPVGGPPHPGVRQLPPPPRDEAPPPAPAETLDEAWAAALAADQRLESKRWEVGAANESLLAAQAQRWPTIGVDNSYTVRSDESNFVFVFPNVPPGTTIPFMQDESYALRAGVQVPLYTGGRIQHGIAAAECGVNQAEWERAAARNDLRLGVAQEYVTVLRAQRNLEVARSMETSLEAHLRDVRLLYEHGQVPQNDLLAAQVALSNARQASIQGENYLDVARAAYNRRLGRDMSTPVRLAELPVEPSGEELDALVDRALRGRPERAQLIAQGNVLRHQAETVRAKNRPQVEVRGDYLFQENRYQTPEGIASASVAVGWNVFDGGRVRHEAAAVSNRAESVLRLQADLESQIALQVRQAWLEVRETVQRIDVTREAVAQAEENLRVVRRRYSTGASTNTEALDAETLRAQASRNFYGATYDAALAAIRLRHATGELKD